MSFVHDTVLLHESVAALHPVDGGCYVDCTLGGGGHTELLLESADCTVIGLDRDPAALAASTERLARFGDRFIPVRATFSSLHDVLRAQGRDKVQGILADIGVSSPQLDDGARGFSIRNVGPIDMRMDPDAELSAAEIVNEWTIDEITKIVRDYGEERHARRVATAIVEGRPWRDTGALAGAVAGVVGKGKGRIHPATRTFQGLRIAVNDELGELERLLAASVTALAPAGWLAIITFHSLEDRLVKQFLAAEAGKQAERDPWGNAIGSFRMAPPAKPVTAPPDDPNPRARSARLRSAMRLP